MNDSNDIRGYRPIQEETSGVGSLLRFLFPFLLIVCAILAFTPELVRMVAPDWPATPTVVRMIAIPVLFLLVVIGGIRSQAKRNESRRAAFSEFAAAVGGEVSNRPFHPTPSGWEGGPGIDYQVKGLPATLVVDRGSRSSFSYRLRVDLVLRRDFQFQILPGGRASRLFLSKAFLSPVFTLAVKAAGSRVGGIAMERVRYVTSDPITTGDEQFDRYFLMKASDASLGRAVATEPSVRAALVLLRDRTQGFQIGLESESATGPGRLVVSTNSVLQGDALVAMDGVLRAAVACLVKLDVIEGVVRGAA